MRVSEATGINRRRDSSVSAHKIGLANIALVEKALKQEWSPEQVSGWLKKERGILISFETIYLHAWATSAKVVIYTRTSGIRLKIKGYRSRKGHHSLRGKIKNRVSIQGRPLNVGSKERIGDWEIT